MTTNPGEATRPPAARRDRFGAAGRAARRHPLATAVLLLAAGVGGLRGWWGHASAKRMAAARDAAAGRGEPVVPADLAAAPLPDAENAWVPLRQATKLDDGSAPSQSSNAAPDYPPFGSLWEKAARASEQANAPVFQFVRQARAYPRAQFVVGPYSTPMFNAILPHVSVLRHVSETVADGATLKHLDGDDVEAVGRIRDVLHVGTLLRQDHWMVSQLVAVGVESIAQQRAQVIAPGLRFEVPGVRPAVVALIADLLDERAVADGLRAGLVGDRLMMADYVGWRAQDVHLLSPLADRHVARSGERYAGFAAAARLGNAEDARRALAAAGLMDATLSWSRANYGRRGSQLIDPYRQWFGDGEPGLGRYLEQHFRVLGDRRATAVSLAARLYRADHGGRWPGGLADLVPAYLPAVPADPYRAGHQPLGYVVLKGALPDGGDRPLAYFEAGEPELNPPVDVEPMFGWHNDPLNRSPRRDVRQYRDLARWAPATRRVDQLIQEEADLRAAEEQRAALARAQDEPPATAPATSPATLPATRPVGGE